MKDVRQPIFDHPVIALSELAAGDVDLLCKKIGMDFNHWRDLGDGKRPFSSVTLDQFRKIAEVLGSSAAYIVEFIDLLEIEGRSSLEFIYCMNPIGMSCQKHGIPLAKWIKWDDPGKKVVKLSKNSAA